MINIDCDELFYDIDAAQVSDLSDILLLTVTICYCTQKMWLHVRVITAVCW